MATPRLSVVIVNYNVKHFLEQALLSVRSAAAGLDAEIWVVDNNSVDDSVNMVREKFPEVHLIANTHNSGFSVANNQAIRQATGDYILLLNPDTVVEEDTFGKVIRFMDEHPEAGGLGVKMIDGAGKFLPESKRGFPTPFVAFCKTFGLSRLFPRSRLFNRYHLGFLSPEENHEVDVLSGAFLLVRRTVLEEIGLLDEQFFMYGEDIDLSYRITLAGYKNYYYSGTQIIHYKGESTKKGSLNYVRVFYNAMIIFARKHFRADKARFFIAMLYGAIYFRAALTLATNLFRKAWLPVLDILLIFTGLYFLKDFWAVYHFKDPDYYDVRFLWYNAPLYTGIWLLTLFFSGAYDRERTPWRYIRGILAGTLLIAAVYGFLEMEYRSSRALILLGAIWALVVGLILRSVLHFFRYGHFNLVQADQKNLLIVGSQEESNRVLHLLQQVQVRKNLIGIVAPQPDPDPTVYLSGLPKLDEVVAIYRIQEIIFCSRDVKAQQIMQWMSRLGPEISYKIVPEESLSIIGSSSKNEMGELYTIDIQYAIAKSSSRRNKRLLDLMLCLFFVLTLPVHLLLLRHRTVFLRNLAAVVVGRKTWVGYYPLPENPSRLPLLKPGVLSPTDRLPHASLNDPTRQRLNFLYAKDYSLYVDLEIIWRGYRKLDARFRRL